MTRKFIYLTLAAFVVAMVHACSLNNNIITPSCKVFETDLVDRWWFASGSRDITGYYFNSNGTCKKKNSDDDMSYTLVNCNKLHIKNHTRHTIEVWDIAKLIPDQFAVNIDNKEMVMFYLEPR